MKKGFLLFLSLVMLCMQTAIAQTTTIRGKVLDDGGEPLPGATVRVNGTSSGTVTDFNGNFRLDVEPGATLTISSIGLKKTEVSAANGMTVKMANNTKVLRETVVTAFGIKKEKRTLGFANTQVDDEILTQGQNGNALTALTGKVAGLQITNSSGTPGASASVQLRGFNTISSNSQPLFVVDGVPISNGRTSAGDPDDGNNQFLTGVSSASRGVDINPDDIESVSVLKGPGATALYGSDGANGVIMITTKSGRGQKGGIGVSLNSSITWDQVNQLPGLQNTYLQGRGGTFGGPVAPNGAHFRESWGPNKDTMFWDGDASYPWDKNGYLVGQSDPTASKKFTPYDNTSFFQTGLTFNNNVALTTASDKSSLRLSLGNLKQSGIVPLSELRRNTVNIAAVTAPTEKFSLSTNINFTNTRGNFVQQGSNLAGIMLGLMRTPISFDNSNGVSDPVNNTEAYLFPDGSMRSFRGFGIYDNPYYTVNENRFTENTNRMYGNVTANYQVSRWLSLTNRFGADMYNTDNQQNFGTQTIEIPTVGMIRQNDLRYRHVNNDLMANITPYISDKFDFSLLLGQNMYSETFNRNFTRATDLIVDGWYNINNASAVNTQNVTNYTFRRMSEYADAKVGFNDILYLGATARLEHATSYWPNFKPNFYSSLYGSFIFSDALNIPSSSALTYGKLRASIATAGINPGPQLTQTQYFSTNVADGWTTGLTNPVNDQVIFEPGNLLNPDLNPEKTRTFEIGTELRFAKNRIFVDYTYYSSRSTDLLLLVPIAQSSGYGNFFTNAGEVTNRGHELQLRFVPIKKRDFRWDVIVNYSRNRNEVIQLAEGVEQVILNGFTGSQVMVRQDEGYGVFMGNGYLRNDAGDVIIQDDPSSSRFGYPILDPTQKNLGSTLPDWIGGINNLFTYKGLSLNFLFDTRQGGVMWNGTRGALSHFGMSKETEGRDSDTKVFEGVYGHLDANGEIVHFSGGSENAGAGGANSTSVALDTDYYFGGEGSGFVTNEPFVEDLSWIKLRELGLSYTFSPKSVGKTRYIKGATLGFVGRNLLLFTDYQGVDPETSLVGASSGRSGKAGGLDYFNNPGTRSYGINLKLNF